MKKNWLTLAMGLLMVLGFTACSKVPVGEVGVKVYLTGGNKGVDHEVLTPGRYYIGVNEDLFLFPTFTQTYNWTKSAHEGAPIDESFSFQDKNGTSLSSDIGISYAFDPNKVSVVFQKFRKGADEITHVYLRSVVRDALVRQASSREIEQIYGVGKSKFIDEVQTVVKAEVAPYGIVIDRIFLIGELRLPPQIQNALNDKIAATQNAMKIENELRSAEADSRKKKAWAEGDASAQVTRAKGEAEANRVVAASITPTLIEWEKAKAFANKWDGNLPPQFGGGTMIDAKSLMPKKQ